jgi:hypothetical protein
VAGDRIAHIPTRGLLRALGLFDTAAPRHRHGHRPGIFLVPAEIARAVRQPADARSDVGGLTLLGALSLAQLAAIPHAGGICTTSRARSPMLGFLCGWMLFTVGRPARSRRSARPPIYLGAFVPLSPAAAKLAAIAAIPFHRDQHRRRRRRKRWEAS